MEEPTEGTIMSGESNVSPIDYGECAKSCAFAQMVKDSKLSMERLEETDRLMDRTHVPWKHFFWIMGSFSGVFLMLFGVLFSVVFSSTNRINDKLDTVSSQINDIKVEMVQDRGIAP